MFQSNRRRGALAVERRAVVALEYALVGTACMFLAMGTLQIGFCLYAKAALNYVGGVAARQLQTGVARVGTATEIQDFKTVTLCATMGGLLDCNAVTMTLFPVPDYMPGSNSNPFDSGRSKSLMLLKLTYAPPIPTWPLQVGTGAWPLLISASIPFMNEY